MGVLPYYGDRADWIAVMKGAISRNAYFFNSHRMMRRYAAVTDQTLRAAAEAVSGAESGLR